MTSRTSQDLKAVFFLPASVKDDYTALPPEVFETANFATFALQNGLYLPKGMTQPLKGRLKGVTELRAPWETNTYRVYYLVDFPAALYIIEAGMKKSHQGGEIPREQLDRLEQRRKKAMEHYESNRDRLETEFHARQRLREMQTDEADGPGPQ